MKRRSFVQLLGTSALAPILPVAASSTSTITKPEQLREGDTVGIVSPAAPLYESRDVQIMVESMEALGLNVNLSEYVTERHGYFAGTDERRAEEFNRMVHDDDIRAIVLARGGWGSSRILPHVDYDAIRDHPKIIVGYSDVTALLLSIHAATGLVTFHGPVGASPWNHFTADHFRSILFRREAPTLHNPESADDTLVPVDHRIRTIRSGAAEGRLVGGNLTLITSLLGTGHLPSWEDALLFTEDIGEAVYRIDRMLTQLGLSGVLDGIGGFIFGTCEECTPERRVSGFTLEDVLDQHIAPLDVPAWSGALIGHQDKKFTVPIGVRAAIDADAGTIRLLEPGVRSAP